MYTYCTTVTKELPMGGATECCVARPCSTPRERLCMGHCHRAVCRPTLYKAPYSVTCYSIMQLMGETSKFECECRENLRCEKRTE